MSQKELEKRVEAYFQTLPGKRGVDIPEEPYDRIFNTANGITRPLWGRAPTPHQLQYLHDNGLHDPDSIHGVFNDLPHPHAPNVKVGEYDAWKQAYGKWNKQK